MKKIIIVLALIVTLSACSPRQEKASWTSQMEASIYKVSTQTGGKILSLRVKEGDTVNAGDTLAVLDARELQYNLEQLLAGLQEINAQEAIFRTQISAAEEDLAYVDTRQGRNERLYEAAVIPRQNLEDGQIQQTRAQNLLRTARQNLTVLDAKRASLQAQQKILQKKLVDTIITSPADGVVETLYYSEGELMPPLGQLAELSDITSPEANIYVSEEWLPRLKPGTKFQIRVQGQAQALSAELIRISNRAEFTPKTVLTPDNRSIMVYAVRLRAENPDGILKDGMPVDISLP